MIKFISTKGFVIFQQKKNIGLTQGPTETELVDTTHQDSVKGRERT